MDKKNCITCFCVIVSLSCFLYAENDNLSEQFGVTEGNSVAEGFVFIDGRYIESPYVISRRGLSLYVNNIKIARPARYAETLVIPGYEDTANLSLEEKQKLFRQLEATRGIYEKYLNRNYGYLFFSKGGHVSLSPHTAAYDMPEVIKILTSNRTKEEKLTELLPHNWHLQGDMEVFVDNFYITNQLLPRLNQLAEELLMADEYGTISGDPINQGFIFINGQYVEAPYCIERRGLGVFINDKMVVRPCWIPENTFSGDTDPEMPKEINSETSINDEVVNNYLLTKQAYLRKNHTIEEERRVMEKVFRNLPFVMEAKLDENKPHILHIKTTEGITISQSLISMRGREVEYDKESVTQRMDSYRHNFHESLEKGDCFIISKRGVDTQLSAQMIKDAFPKMIGILNSEKSTSQKYSEIRQAGINIADKTLAELVANFSMSPQLQSHISKLEEARETNGKKK